MSNHAIRLFSFAGVLGVVIASAGFLFKPPKELLEGKQANSIAAMELGIACSFMALAFRLRIPWDAFALQIIGVMVLVVSAYLCFTGIRHPFETVFSSLVAIIALFSNSLVAALPNT